MDQKIKWLERRRKGVGASEVASALGLNPYKDPVTLWAEKTGRITDEPGPEAMARINRGKVLEAQIADDYAHATGLTLVDPGQYESVPHPQCPVLFATIDRKILDLDRDTPGALEIKATAQRHAIQWDQGPQIYLIQLQTQLEVHGWAWGVLHAQLCPDDVDEPLPESRMERLALTRSIIKARDEELGQKIIAEVERFWWHVEKDKQPDANGSWSCREILHKLHPEEDAGKTIQLGDRAAELALELETARITAREANDRKRAIENEIKQMMGDAERGEIPGGGAFQWRVEKRAARAMPESSPRILRKVRS